MIPVNSRLAVIRHGDWDYRLQFDAALEEWPDYTSDFDKTLASVQFIDTEG